MKVIGKAGTDVLVTMDRKELAAIAGKSYYDDSIGVIFDKGYTPEIDVNIIAENMQTVKGIPTELKQLQKTVNATKEIVDKAVEALTKLPVLSTKTVIQQV